MSEAEDQPRAARRRERRSVDAEQRRTAPPRVPIPPLLSDVAGWGWRLLLLAVIAYLMLQVALKLYLVFGPIAAALLIAAFLTPAARRLQRWGLPRWLAVTVTFLGAILLLGGALTWVVDRAIAEAPRLVDRLQQTLQDLPLSNARLQQLRSQISDYLSSQKGTLASGVVSGVQTVGEVLTGALLTLLLTIILVADGDRMWHWLVTRLPESGQPRTDIAGRAAWSRLSGWIRGTFVIAAFHGVVIGVTLLLLGVPLVAPLAILVFVGSFIPLIGALIFGALSVVVTFATQGLTAAIILTIVLVVENQFEAHVLQPFLVGRYVRLHPFVVAVVITAGALVAGLVGALLAVPLTAALVAAVAEGKQPVDPGIRRKWARNVAARAAGTDP